MLWLWNVATHRDLGSLNVGMHWSQGTRYSGLSAVPNIGVPYCTLKYDMY